MFVNDTTVVFEPDNDFVRACGNVQDRAHLFTQCRHGRRLEVSLEVDHEAARLVGRLFRSRLLALLFFLGCLFALVLIEDCFTQNVGETAVLLVEVLDFEPVLL